MDISAGIAHPNIIVEGDYGDHPDNLFSVYPAQPDKFDEEQSESWNEDTEGIICSSHAR
jgi:hypothetical protein